MQCSGLIAYTKSLDIYLLKFERIQKMRVMLHQYTNEVEIKDIKPGFPIRYDEDFYIVSSSTREDGKFLIVRLRDGQATHIDEHVLVELFEGKVTITEIKEN